MLGLGEEAEVPLKPLVALESALISHGLPYPKNGGDSAGHGRDRQGGGSHSCHDRDHRGEPRAGLSREEEERLARGSGVHKVSLDLPFTLERLETSGVPVIGYGIGEFPAFYSRSSGSPLEQRVDTPQDVAEIARARDELGLSTAILVTVPVPEEYEVPDSLVEEALTKALEMAEAQGVRGAALTPFLLEQLNELTQGATLRANIALLKNNARVAAGVAQALVMA